jgi:hypothetical protein
MSDIQEKLRRASSLARLQAIIELTRDAAASLDAWPTEERHWFTQLLSPFAVGTKEQHQLAAQHQMPAATPPISALIEELRRTHFGNPGDMLREFDATVALLRKLLDERPILDRDDISRVHHIASTLRRRLIQEQSFTQRPGIAERMS